MKKILISAAVILAALFVIHACTREGEEKHEAPQTAKAEAFEQLNVLIDNYTQTFFEQHGAAITRSPEIGDYNPLVPVVDRRFRQIMKADLGGVGLGMLGGGLFGWIGALIGGLVNGVISSVRAARVDNTEIVINPETDYTKVYYESLENGNIFDYAGIAHNVIIQNMAKLYGTEFLETASDRELFEATLTEIEKLGYDVRGVTFENAIITEHFDSIYDAICTGDSKLITSAFLKACPTMGNEAEVIASYMEAIDKLDATQLQEYATGCRKIVMESNVAEQSKNAINAAISTSVGSGELWQVATN